MVTENKRVKKLDYEKERKILTDVDGVVLDWESSFTAWMNKQGYTVQRDLTGFGHFLFMGLIGLIIAMVVNIFLASSALQFTISIIGVFIFTGLTAWDTQNAKKIYLTHGGDPRFGIQFAISLYLNFINLFQMLLALLGNRE